MPLPYLDRSAFEGKGMPPIFDDCVEVYCRYFDMNEIQTEEFHDLMISSNRFKELKRDVRRMTRDNRGRKPSAQAVLKQARRVDEMYQNLEELYGCEL